MINTRVVHASAEVGFRFATQTQATFMPATIAQVVRLISVVDAVNLHGDQPVHIACSHNCLHVVQWLHERGVPLDVAANTGGQAIHFAAKQGHLAIIQWLHERGVPLDVASDSGRQPIDFALKKSHQAVVKWLRERGCVQSAS